MFFSDRLAQSEALRSVFRLWRDAELRSAPAASEGRGFSPAAENRVPLGALAPEAALLQGLKAPLIVVRVTGGAKAPPFQDSEQLRLLTQLGVRSTDAANQVKLLLTILGPDGEGVQQVEREGIIQRLVHARSHVTLA